MTTLATVRLAEDGKWLHLRCPAAKLDEQRQFSRADYELLKAWAIKHRLLAHHQEPINGSAQRARQEQADALLKLGEELFAWLNGPEQFLSRLLNTVQPPLLSEFAVSRQDSAEARAFLDAPWELLAAQHEHWALSPNHAFCPLRRIGQSLDPPDPAPYRLSLVFLAASPRAETSLDYEGEEASFLLSTRGLGLDLVVEESGTLELLAACLARELPEVAHISCHGRQRPSPGLLLEDELGDGDWVNTAELVRRLADYRPRMLFLSACESAGADPVFASLAWSLVWAGLPAVLGWAAPVYDHEARIFAASLYRRLTAGDDLAHALAYARLDLAQAEELRDPAFAGHGSRDWHLARLYLGAQGGGRLAKAGGPLRRPERGQAVRTFLDAKGQVPVASELEFVGRRREMQAILRELRAPRSQRHAGVLIHGLGRQGKSSLAARLAQRLEHSHDLVVLYGRYDAPAVLAAFREQVATPAVSQIVSQHLPQVQENPADLLPALTELLQGPCAQEVKDTSGRRICRPVLLVVDDLEQALLAQPAGLHVPQPQFVEPLRALLKAFDRADTDSRLLFTSRFRFTLPEDGRDLATRLLDVPLHRMDEREAGKQAAAKLRLLPDTDRRARNRKALQQRLGTITAAALGNPGLQDLLFLLCLDDPEACDRCLAQMAEYQRSGRLPDEQKARDFLEDLAIRTLLELLLPGQRQLLRASTLLELPAPLEVLELLARAWGGSLPGDPARLVALGLWEVYEDLYDAHRPALALHALVRPLAGVLNESEQRALARAVAPALFDAWGGKAGGRRRGYLQDHELTRLALLAREPRLLAATTADALRFLERQFAYLQAAAWARQAIAILDEAQLPASVDLLRTAAERQAQVGEVQAANALLQRALVAIQRGAKLDREDHAATLITHARALVDQGQPDQAQVFLEQASALLPPGREQAIVLGDIARLRADKGDVDGALALQRERLTVNETLGDADGIASALWDIAQIELSRQSVEAAFEPLVKSYAIFQRTGRLEGICMVGVYLGQLLCAAGQQEEGLQVLQRSRDGFRRLGQEQLARQVEELMKQAAGSQ